MRKKNSHQEGLKLEKFTVSKIKKMSSISGGRKDGDLTWPEKGDGFDDKPY